MVSMYVLMLNNVLIAPRAATGVGKGRPTSGRVGIVCRHPVLLTLADGMRVRANFALFIFESPNHFISQTTQILIPM
jgi:hypothetical protein